MFMLQLCREHGCRVCQCEPQCPQLHGLVVHPQPLDGSGSITATGLAQPESQHCHHPGISVMNITTVISEAHA